MKINHKKPLKLNFFKDPIQNCGSLDDYENSSFEVDESEVIETANESICWVKKD